MQPRRHCRSCYAHLHGVCRAPGRRGQGHRSLSAATLEARYPGLAAGLLRSAVLAPIAEDTLLEADGLVITQPQLLAGIQEHEPKLRVQDFFDAEGREVFRHVGFFARDDVNRQQAEMGVAK